MNLFGTTGIALLENLDKKGYYMMFASSHELANKRYEQYTRTGRYDETGMKEPYGYPEFNIGMPLFNKLQGRDERYAEYFLSFIKDNKVSDHTEIDRAAEWGWFKFSEAVNIEKWQQEYDAYDAKKQQEYLRINNTGLQTALF